MFSNCCFLTVPGDISVFEISVLVLSPGITGLWDVKTETVLNPELCRSLFLYLGGETDHFERLVGAGKGRDYRFNPKQARLFRI